MSDEPKKVLDESDKQTVYCLDSLVDTVNLLQARGYSGKAVGQALLTTISRFINIQPNPLATLIVCIRAIGACVIADMRSQGQAVDVEAVMRAYALTSDTDVEVINLDEETLRQADGGAGGDEGKKSN